jgi:hypothetical protein
MTPQETAADRLRVVAYRQYTPWSLLKPTEQRAWLVVAEVSDLRVLQAINNICARLEAAQDMPAVRIVRAFQKELGL